MDVDRWCGGDGTTRESSVDVHVLIRALDVEKEHMGKDRVSHDGSESRSDENNPVLEESRVDIKGSFATSIGFDDGGDVVVVLGSRIHV